MNIKNKIGVFLNKKKRSPQKQSSGRKPISDELRHLKRERLTVRLPQWLLDFIMQYKSQGKLVEKALLTKFKKEINFYIKEKKITPYKIKIDSSKKEDEKFKINGVETNGKDFLINSDKDIEEYYIEKYRITEEMKNEIKEKIKKHLAT